ncbi:MAG TPA: 4'-phosphopantetheinyl transferase superfamily protein [Terriglobales bacterium]|nr:4'-phosphopantetheinyl transferase superfamily protein [Terriglobales bacterium]
MVAGTLDLYWFALDLAPATVAGLRELLPAEECARADRFLMPEHGRRFTVAHARLRALLAARLRAAPRELRFTHGPQGKPVLEGAPLHFNLSHSAGYGLIGIHPQRELGVDIEIERAQMDVMGLARRFFTARETVWLAALPEAARRRGFSRLWTCKEAWLKADGRGMAVLDQIEVELGDELGDEGARLRPSAGPGREWFVRELELVNGYAAAVVQAEPPAAVTVARLGTEMELAPAVLNPSARPAAAGPPPSTTRSTP